ncbi:MAG: hypothetical protein JXR37_29625, partial [Kiritimatiellae bacterium]|nr:hypothetical protein [Kiritimatiellia bacterium]
NISLGDWNTRGVVENNTLYGGKGLYINDPLAVTNRSNIIWATGSGKETVRVAYPPAGADVFVSDHNDLYATDGAAVGNWGGGNCPDLGSWQSSSSNDNSSVSVAPAFVDPDGPDDLLGDYYGENDDFHLQSMAGSYHLAGGIWTNDLTNSPCIDAGDPWNVFTNEPAYNGLRVNQGAYGNTEYASKSDYSGPFYSLTTAAVPTNGGYVSAWPVAAGYPTNRATTVIGTANQHYSWDQWTGDLSGSNNPTSLFMSANMVVTGVFAAICSNTNGTPDWWLAHYGIATNQAGAEGHGDGDNVENWREYFADTDPTNAESVLLVTNILAVGTNVTIEWCGGRAARQYLEMSLELGTNAAWMPVYTNEPPTETEQSYVCPSVEEQAYFRIRVERPD